MDQLPHTEAAPDTRRSVPAGVALLLLLPALVALFVSYVGPTFWTVRTSFLEVDPIQNEQSQREPSQFVGLENYGTVAEGLAAKFGFALSFGVLPLLTLLVLAPLLAYTAHQAGRGVRWLVRIALAVPMAIVGTSVLASGWLIAEFEDQSRSLTRPDSARMELWFASWLTTFGLVCGIGVTLYLAVLRHRNGRPAWPAALVVGALGLLTTVALALQSLGYPLVLTAGGPADATMTPLLDVYRFGFQYAQFGAAAAEATVLLVPLMLLGIVAAVLVMLSGLRMEPTPARLPGESNGNVGAAIAAVALLAVVLVVSWLGTEPALSRLGGAAEGEPPAMTVLANTWLPPLVSTVVGVGIAALGGYAIGALRPLGRHSEALLLPFAPWLFVGSGPLALANWTDVREDEQLNSFVGLIPPVWIVLPALFLFTVLFRGTRSSWSGVPMLLLVGGFTWLVQAQDLLWPLLVVSDPDQYTAPLLIVQRLREFGTTGEAVLGGTLLLPAFAVFAVGLAVAQVLYLDRLAIRTGSGVEPGAQR